MSAAEEQDFHTATCASCGLHLTRPYDAIWAGTRPWRYIAGVGHLCPVCQDQRERNAMTRAPHQLTLQQLRQAEQRAIDRVQALQTGTSLTRYDTVREAQRVLKQIRTRIENRP